jgi:hypothetical protein
MTQLNISAYSGGIIILYENEKKNCVNKCPPPHSYHNSSNNDFNGNLKILLHISVMVFLGMAPVTRTYHVALLLFGSIINESLSLTPSLSLSLTLSLST